MYLASVLVALCQEPAAAPTTTSSSASGLAHWLVDWFQHRAGDFAQGLALALATFVIGLWIAKLLTGALRRLLVRGKVDDTLAKFLGNLAYYVLVTLVALAALERVGVQTASFIAILGAAGLAVGFALQGSLGNLASGVMIMFFRPFKVGDLVTAGGHEGIVEEIQVFATVLNTLDNKRVILPNSAVTGAAITNLTGNATRRVDMTFGVAGSEQVARVKSVVESALATIPQILKSPPPDIEALEVGAAMKFTVRPWCKSTDYWVVYFAVNEAVKLAFEREHVAGPVPRTEVVTVK